jgi:hypothetical protein
MILEVDDTDEFLTNADVVTSLQEAMATLLELPEKDVTITSISLVTATGRRLKGAQGKVKPAFKAKAPVGKVAPAKVPGLAPKLPAAVNPLLKKKGVPGKVGKATIPTPVVAKKPTKKADPCKVQIVVAPPVVVPAPVNPCAPVVVQPAPVAPVNPCAPVVKSEQGAVVQSASSPALLAMVSLAVPCLIGMVMFVRRRRQARESAVYNNLQDATDLE